jgi:hypothetical protein
VISSPNRPVYNEDAAVRNEFHVRELDRDELRRCSTRCSRSRRGSRSASPRTRVWREGAAQGDVRYDVARRRRAAVAGAPAPPMYFVVVCAARASRCRRCPRLSLFDDGALSLWRDYATVALRARQLAWDELDARRVAEDRLAELVTAVNGLSSERQKTRRSRERVRALEARSPQRMQRATRARRRANRGSRRDARALAFRESLAAGCAGRSAAARRAAATPR